ncbi:MAG TPA: MgtC/SapB family protein [Candidatus Paceibacterota bacterium]|nr:MgtC/SapB family protein [Candidatus Paceibacterota bacterium]
MDIASLIGPLEAQFLIALGLSIILGYLIGAERELRDKDAGISTHVLVISGAMLFTFISLAIEGTEARITAQIVTGIGFLGAGLILKDGTNVRNLTTAASLWLAAGLGVAIGYGFYVIAVVAALIGALVPRIPNIHKKRVRG